MLLWNRRSRLILWSVFAVVITVVFIAPVATVVLAGFSGAWTGPLPTQLSFMRYEKALGRRSREYGGQPANCCHVERHRAAAGHLGGAERA